jgi:ankyrin repeat protein
LSEFSNKYNVKKGGATALSWASLYGHSTCIGPLLDAGADVNSFDQVVVRMMMVVGHGSVMVG